MSKKNSVYLERILEMHFNEIKLKIPAEWIRKNEYLKIAGELVYPRRRMPSRIHIIPLELDKNYKSIVPISSHFADTILFKEVVEGPFAIRFTLIKTAKTLGIEDILVNVFEPLVFRRLLQTWDVGLFKSGVLRELLVQVVGGQIKKNDIPVPVAQGLMSLEAVGNRIKFKSDSIKIVSMIKGRKERNRKEEKQGYRKAKQYILKPGDDFGNLTVKWRMV